MTTPRIYLPRPLNTGDICEAAKDQARYLGAVLRMEAGDALVVFNGSDWEYNAVIRHTQAGSIALEVTGKRPVALDEIDITLCQAIPKAEKMDAIIRHATELGVGRVIPFVAERSIPHWTEAKRSQKRERWQKIIVEASRQSCRSAIPEIGEVVPFAEMVRFARPEGLNFIPWEEEARLGMRDVLRDPRYAGMKSFCLAIGPEGGFSNEEIERAREAGFLPVTLGRRVLRVETAALAVLAVLQYERGTLGDPHMERVL
jgi:16S rRNA (uracil1498-N3)-methyltransferase